MAEDLLFEIGTEELPWGAVQDGRKQLRENMAAALERERLDHEEISIFSTPRRLTALVKGLAGRQKDIESQVRGPSREKAYDGEGKPSAAAIGFARSKGVPVEELQIWEAEKGEFVFAVIREQGKDTFRILPEMLAELIRSFSFKKTMRWGEGEFRFARPIRWMVALYGEKVIPLVLEGVEAGPASRGHRYLCKKEVVIGKPSDYLEALREGCVLADEMERRRAVKEGVEEAVYGKSLKAVPSPDTLDEVMDLVEYPHVVMGYFDEKYLDLPHEVLETAMQEHQRYFPLEREGGEPAPAFLVVHNGDTTQVDAIRIGNERVLRARLEDASFFFKEDRCISQEQRLERLKSVVWQAQLGNMYEKSLRLEDLSGEISRLAHLGPLVSEKAQRAAILSKTDLVTAMVIEFTSLQGVIGRIYASLEGEDPETAMALEEQYRPRIAGDSLPQTLPGAVLSLADKADNLAGCFGADLIPTGSEDPYALRRQAQAIMAILVNSGMHLDFQAILEHAAGKFGFPDPAAIAREAGDFCLQRWRQSLISEGFSYDLVAAVLPLALRDPADARGRLEAMQHARNEGLLQKAYTGFERCWNLSRKAGNHKIDESLLVEEAEKELYSRLVWSQEPLREYLDNDEYQAALEVLLALAPHIDRFFEEIFVMGDELQLRDNRLALLANVAGLFLEFADFSQVVTGE
ncbi:MAG: glycine--tRNA ligase subunit beta [Actinobacteria bacterium RBG_19FT_COMBO_54_7]|uniref:Glycine--tRNA ligase beta subunit n=1 Tax=Candidatus Solincola sediminis TaxID=1797199 RepID=A0A1F2WFF0_9ACTN|nr:MAG: glycine--tRNA ligase subunit beta [Candidatus Solincola sediminis]OFW57756.1 MAG: glycine--tRNA ligase subunit beta [Candidatus Solincola sediminis]OFW66112.1 MAG: glycine--tRNA ligase subunit beta [Actinobacteria bacterium RBG_19FT_COMBO_54_7]